MPKITLLLLATGFLACYGRSSVTAEGPGGSTDGTTAPGAPGTVSDALCQVAPSPLRRLTPEQYVNTAGDLLSLDSVSVDLAPAETEIITALEVEKFGNAASLLAATLGHERFLPAGCSATADHQDASLRQELEGCAKDFILAFGKSAFRRPLKQLAGDDEVEWLLSKYRAVRDAHLAPDDELTEPFTFRESLAAIAELVLQSGQHLYLAEEGAEDSERVEGAANLTGYERATRLSYFLWNTTPDPILMEAAAAGELDNEEGVRLHATRMLEDPRARAVVRRFASAYLDLDATPQHPRLEELPKSEERFPFDSPSLRSAMRRESEALFERVFFDEGGSFPALLSSNMAYVNSELAGLYGLQGGPTSSSEFVWLELDPTRRAGLFTRAAFLAKNGDQEYQSPIHRGVNLFRDALCQPLGPPPPNANDVAAHPEVKEGEVLTTRRQTELKTSGVECSGCHELINPFGFALEHYDAMGQWQDVERVEDATGATVEAPIDATSEIIATDVAGVVNGGVELSQRLASSQLAQDCMAQQWFEQAVARPVTAADSCSITAIQERFRASKDLRQLVVDVVTSPALLLLDRQSR